MLLSEVYKNNSTKRIDSEYFLKQDLVLADYMEKNNFQTFNELNIVVKGGKRIPKGENFSEEGYPYIRAQDNKNNLIFSEMSPKISESIYKKLKNYDVKYNEIIITNVGNSIGDVGIFKEDDKKCILTENCVKVYNKNTLLREYIYTFLKTKYGMSQIRRETVGTAQPKLALERIREFKIAKISRKIQEKIKGLVDNSVDNIILSKKLYYQAEKFFISELGFEDFKPSNERVSVKSLKKSFLKTGRLDSEYYQEKYDELFEKLSKNKTEKLSNLVRIKKSIEPGSENYQTEGIPFIRVQDLSKFGLSTPNIFLPKNKFKDSITPRKNAILLSKDGSVGMAYKMNKAEKIITSSAILHLEIKNEENILPDYLTLVLNSTLVKMQAERDAGGSIINHWKKSEIKNVIIPIIEKEKQEKISKLLVESENLRNESKFILEKAIKSIEIAIECSEEEAINYLNT